MKTATKDIDIIVSTKEEFLELQDTLRNIGFLSKLPGREYSRMNLSQIFQRDDFRIDLFEKEVCGRFLLSENMKNRAEKVLQFNHLTIYLCSNEDIFLFKTMTEREGDISDCLTIAQTHNPNWTIIMTELKRQIEHSKQGVWVTWVGERFDILKERGLDIPIMNKLNALRNKFLKNLEKKQSGSL